MFRFIVSWVFRRAGVEINGPNPWDPQIEDDRFYRRVALQGSLGLGESYMDGWWRCRDMNEFLRRLLEWGVSDGWVPRFDAIAMRLKSWFSDEQDRIKSKRVATEHYDTEPAFFMRLLGGTGIYTCARWKGVDNLDDAQIQKVDLLCRKAELRPGDKVVDFGSGWGGTLAHAATRYGAEGIGISISRPQVESASEKYHNLPIEFRLQDYRDFDEKVTRILSVCMIEHVGSRHLREYFQVARNAIADDGIFVLQCIVSFKERTVSDPWLDKHIFPGGELITLSGLEEGVRDLFHILDAEYFGGDYVKTLTAWYNNLVRDKVAIIAQYGEEHFRKYEYYFQSCIGAFLSGRITVAQFVLSPTPRPDYVPIRL